MIDNQLLWKLADQIRIGVAEYHGRNPGDFDDLEASEQDAWISVATTAVELSVDKIIEAGRPIWWTEP